MNELINFENKDLTNIKDLIALEEKANIQVSDYGEEPHDLKAISVKWMSEAFQMITGSLKFFRRK